MVAGIACGGGVAISLAGKFLGRRIKGGPRTLVQDSMPRKKMPRGQGRDATGRSVLLMKERSEIIS
jgi:hypothetical protein